MPDVTGKDRRVVLAKWLASPENPYFATNLGNIVWSHFFGLGIIDEVDDVRISNPATQPRIAGRTGQEVSPTTSTTSRSWYATSALSRTYQLSTQANASNDGDTRNFAQAYLRRIKAETFLDCISQVTETKNKFPGLPLGARAVQIADGVDQQLLPDDLRPGDARDGLLLRGASSSRRCRNRCTCSTATRRRNGSLQGNLIGRASGGEEDARRRSSRSCSSAA